MNELKIKDITYTPGVIEFNNFEAIKNEVTLQVEKFKNLVVTEEGIQEAKKDRAALNALSKSLNDKRKDIKKIYNEPLSRFESKIKEIDAIILEAVGNLDTQVKDYETAQKQAKTDELKTLFDDLIKVNDLTFVTFEQANINVILTASMKSLKESVHSFINQIVSDLKLIETQPNKERILVEYHKSLNASDSILKVTEAIKREEEVKARQLELEAQKTAQMQSEPVLQVIEEPSITAPIEIEEELMLTFKVYGTKTQLKALKEYIERAGLKYDN